MTVLLSASALACAFVLGMVLCLVKLYARRPFSSLAEGYIQFVRGTPLLVQLYFLYFGLPNVGVSIDAMTAGFSGLALNSAAYVAEILRGGLLSVPPGQWQAAAALGMRPAETLRHVVLPQALRSSIPALANEFITLVKSSSLLATLAILEVTHAGQIVRASTYASFECFSVVAAVYLVLTTGFAWGLGRLERRMRVGG